MKFTQNVEIRQLPLLKWVQTFEKLIFATCLHKRNFSFSVWESNIKKDGTITLHARYISCHFYNTLENTLFA